MDWTGVDIPNRKDGETASPRKAPMTRLGIGRPMVVALVVVLFIQIFSALFFVFKLLSDVLLWQAPFIPWEVQELLEILCSIGLLLGVGSSLVLLRISFRRVELINRQLDAAAGQFQTLIERQFDIWELTKTERHVALLVIKGFSNSEVARLRGTSESTIKSQLTSIFRKAKLNTRQQLVASVIEDIVSAIPEP